MPPRSMIKPARMKNGTASRMKLPVPLTMLCGSTTIEAVPVIHMIRGGGEQQHEADRHAGEDRDEKQHAAPR